MKDFIKGIFLGLSLVVANKICCFAFESLTLEGLMVSSGVVYFLITTAFLVSKNISGLLLCGFSGLFVMFFGEIFVEGLTGPFYSSDWLMIYIGGFYGSMAALALSIVFTVKKIKISDLFKGDMVMDNMVEKNLKIKLLIYALITAVTFSYLVMPENAGISVGIFVIIQFICLWFIVPDRKRLFLFIPVTIMSFNCFWSASTVWRISNFLISAVLYSCMFVKFDFRNDSIKYFVDIAERIVTPIKALPLPLKWILEINSSKAPVIKRIVLALIVSIPSMLLLILLLSNADMVFSMKTEKLFSDIIKCFDFHTVFIIICGIIVGLYLFGVIYSGHTIGQKEYEKETHIKGDLIIINILLLSALVIYTLFVIVQFKYLFAGSALPQGLTYTEYARKGFFELLALTGVNIAAILTVIKFTKNYSGKWYLFTKVLCHYLCAVTIVLLISSFYRMMLYTNDDGLTRLRFYVLGFLIFEGIGLLLTFVYIAKPKMNITLIYLIIALTYYSVLNIVPADNIIARNQIDKYLNGERDGLSYIFTLSADAAPAIDYLLDNTEDEELKKQAKEFIEEKTTSDIPQRWQRYNLSVEKAKSYK